MRCSCISLIDSRSTIDNLPSMLCLLGIYGVGCELARVAEIQLYQIHNQEVKLPRNRFAERVYLLYCESLCTIICLFNVVFFRKSSLIFQRYSNCRDLLNMMYVVQSVKMVL